MKNKKHISNISLDARSNEVNPSLKRFLNKLSVTAFPQTSVNDHRAETRGKGVKTCFFIRCYLFQINCPEKEKNMNNVKLVVYFPRSKG